MSARHRCFKAGVWFRRSRLFMVSPDSLGTACPLSGRNSTYRPVQISETSSDPSPAAPLTSDNLISLLEGAFSFAIFTLLLLLSGVLPHGVLQSRSLKFTGGASCSTFLFWVRQSTDFRWPKGRQPKGYCTDVNPNGNITSDNEQ